MSQAVDLSTPLTTEEFKYLQERNRTDLIERAHEMHGTSDADYAAVLSAGDGTGPQPRPLLQGEARAARADQLRAELASLEAEESDADADDEDSDDEALAYEEMTVSQLDAELKARGLPTSGSKPDKVKRLEDDDAAE